MRPTDRANHQGAANAVLCTALVVSSTLLAPSAHAKPVVRECQNTHYTVVELPFLPEVISPSGVVAGVTEAQRAVVWRKGSGVQKLVAPDGFQYTQPAAITRSGDLVVNATDAGARKHGAFVYSRGSVTALVGSQALVHGISPSGLIVGEWVPDGKVTAAVYWNGNIPHALHLCCGGVLKAGNRAGDLVGDAYDAHGRYHAFVWSQSRGQQQVVGPAASSSSAIAIDDAGSILIQVGSKEGYLQKKSNLLHLELSSKPANSLNGMNNCEFIVGGYGTDSDHYNAFLWTAAAGFQDLNSLIATDSGWRLRSALAINDRGEIVGRGDFADDDTGFLLIPQR